MTDKIDRQTDRQIDSLDIPIYLEPVDFQESCQIYLLFTRKMDPRNEYCSVPSPKG